ncbi:MAG: hypothetical protein KZQ94_18910 [Candidatus Thiodiazotropha sp. (ex Troendleina suluensis)]|nr:hypothetical protein [Candidatus Thiodiazotropha sp. (ex Troendleina suluensis)]
MAIALTALSAWMLWPQIRPRWQAYLINRRIQSISLSMPEEATISYLEAIDELLDNAGYHRLPGLTIEQYLEKLVEMDITTKPDQLSHLFNQLHYAKVKENLNPDGYKKLFDTLYSLGHSRLKQRIVNISQQK